MRRQGMKTFQFCCTLAMLIVLTSAVFSGVPREGLRVHFIDAGYGDSILVETPGGKNILVDAGSAGTAPALRDYLARRGIERLHACIATHPHENHFGGFPAVLERLPVEAFYLNGDDRRAEPGYGELVREIRGRGVPFETVRRGDVILNGPAGVTIKALHPDELNGSANENSLVLWITYRETGFLLTADILPPQQDDILRLFPRVKEAQVVQVPHHGGAVSPLFVKEMEGKIFVVSTGENAFGMPKEAQLEQLKGRLLRTDRDGTITFVSDGQTVRTDDD